MASTPTTPITGVFASTAEIRGGRLQGRASAGDTVLESLAIPPWRLIQALQIISVHRSD